jgi:hypothetical protein
MLDRIGSDMAERAGRKTESWYKQTRLIRMNFVVHILSQIPATLSICLSSHVICAFERGPSLHRHGLSEVQAVVRYENSGCKVKMTSEKRLIMNVEVEDVFILFLS